MHHEHAHDDDHDDHGGLHRDLLATGAVMDRRSVLRLMASGGMSLGLLQLMGCGTQGDGPTDVNSDVVGACVRIPSETAGPFPADASNGLNVLSLAGVVRRDIRSSFAGLNGTAAGVPLTVELTLVSASTCAPLAGHAVYLWHCDRAALYSLYSAGVTNQNYLRGVQAADAEGRVTFTTIFPGCYRGRWPHMHFEVFPSLARATSAANILATSQLALPKAPCDAVYATSGYESSVGNLARISLASDQIFRDGSARQLATVTGSVASGYVASLTVAV